MEVPFVDLPQQIKPYEIEIRKMLDKVMFERADFIMREDLREFEERFAAFVGTKHAVGVANGSDALNLALRVLEIGPGDEVITVAHTFVATIAAIKHAGATPVLVDVGDDHNLDVDLLEMAITDRTRAIIPVHLNGRVCRMDRILKIAEKYRLHIVEDSAQAIGARYKGLGAGTFGILSTNSFYPFKILGCFGDGGAITTNSDELDFRLRCLRDNGQDRASGEILYWGWNSRLDNLQAAILNIMLDHLPEIILRRRQLAKIYSQGLIDLEPAVKIPVPYSEQGDFFDSFQNFVICVKQRNKLVAELRSKGIGVLVSWPRPTHLHPHLRLSHFSLPRTEDISNRVVSLPLHPALTDDEVRYVVETVRGIMS